MMKKQILLYGYIYNLMARDFINDLQDANEDELLVRVNSGGGDVEAGYGIISNLRDYPGKLKIKVDGAAHSMALLALAYFDDVEAVDVSQFLLHRAAYPNWVESREDFKGSAAEARLIEMNKNLKKALENKIDVEAFEKLKGIKFNEVFSMENRVDVVLTSREAKKIGLINKVEKMSSAKAAEFNKLAAAASSSDNLKDVPALPAIEDGSEGAENSEKIKNQNKNKKQKTMTVQEFKKENPEAFASMQNEIINAERDRVNAWLTFQDVDAEAVKKGIESGEAISQTQMADFNKKIAMAGVASKVENETDDVVEVNNNEPKTQKTDAEKHAEAEAKLTAETLKELGIEQK